jgi:energy-converting hydrogenase Eha subunit A
MNTTRPDPRDLTPLVSHLTQAKRDEHERLRWQSRACIPFWIIALGFAVVSIWWGWKQCL